MFVLLNNIHKQFATVGVIVGVGVNEGVGVGVGGHDSIWKYSHPFESVTLTKIEGNESNGDGTINVNVGGIETEPLIVVQ